MNTSLYIFIAAGLVLILIIALYNKLIRLKNRVQEAWSDIDVQLKRRYDLIPNLLESVRGYMQHEKTLLENITAARSMAMNAEQKNDKTEMAKTESALAGLVGNLLVAVEAYPDLKANDTVRELMNELSDTENKIQAARRFYNGMTRDFNTAIETFPSNLFAKMLKFSKFDFFEVSDAKERENVQVKF